jgi:copper oxidase (laccase) domain-containing protein
VIDQAHPAPSEIPAGLRVAGVRQVHGSDVVNVGVGARGPHRDGDAALATDEETCVAVLVADCLPIAIGSPEGVRLAVHAGWRGLVAGIVGTAAAAARTAGASALVGGLGPCIGPCCYEFSPEDLERVTGVLGDRVAAKTVNGKDSLDIRRAAHEALDAAGVRVDTEDDSCTSCGAGWYSARARADTARQALYVWRVH